MNLLTQSFGLVLQLPGYANFITSARRSWDLQLTPSWTRRISHQTLSLDKPGVSIKQVLRSTQLPLIAALLMLQSPSCPLLFKLPDMSSARVKEKLPQYLQVRDIMNRPVVSSQALDVSSVGDSSGAQGQGAHGFRGGRSVSTPFPMEVSRNHSQSIDMDFA